MKSLKVHLVKTSPEVLAAMETGGRNFDVQPCSRPIQLREWICYAETTLLGTLSGRWIIRRVDFRLTWEECPMIAPGFTVLGLSRHDDEDDPAFSDLPLYIGEGD